MDAKFKKARLQRKAENIDIYERVKSAFGTVGITTQNEIAKTCGLGQGSVSRWANGVNYPTIRNMLDISRRTRHCVQWLYSGEGPRLIEGNADHTDEITAILNALPEATRKELEEYIRYRAKSI